MEEDGSVTSSLTAIDTEYLRTAIDLSRHALEDQGKTPFGSILVINGEILGEGTSSVIELFDPSAHAEVMALRNAARKLQQHLLPGSVLYSSSEPCPMCLTACYWAQVSRIVFGATKLRRGNLRIRRPAALPRAGHRRRERSLPEVKADQSLRTLASDVLRNWAKNFPQPVTPKY